MKELCFFTMSDNNRRYIHYACNLIASAYLVGRKVWYYKVPESFNDHPKRYKMELLAGDLLPEADKYIYLDADTLMLKRGQWESDKIMGTNEVKERSHQLHFKTPAHKRVFHQWCKDYGAQESNTGCVVLPASIRKQVGERWKFWCKAIDDLLIQPPKTKDQFQFRFVKKEFNLPNLPPEYLSSSCKNNVTEDSVQVQMSGLPRGRNIYIECHEKIFGYFIGYVNKDKKMSIKYGMQDGYRSRNLAELIMANCNNHPYLVGAEVGVGRGRNARWLLGMFPGLRLHCIDPWIHVSETRHIWSQNYLNFISVKKLYGDRCVEHKSKSLETTIEEPLDFVFIDADHRTENVIDDIRYWTLKVKEGGLIAGHDLDYKGRYYSKDSVRKALDEVFGPKNWNKGPGFLWWRIKDGTDLRPF